MSNEHCGLEEIHLCLLRILFGAPACILLVVVFATTTVEELGTVQY